MKRVPKMYVNIRKIPRMWEKAFRGDDGSQFSRKRPERPCGLNSKGLSLCFFELNYKQDTRANAQGRIIGNKHHKALGTSRADVCWNGRRPCEPEFNSRIRGKAVRNGPLDRSDVKNVKRSADDSGKWTPFLLFRVQLLRIRGKSFTVRRIWVWALLLV